MNIAKAPSPFPSTPRSWRRSAWIAGALLAIAALAAGGADFRVADALFYDRGMQAWIGADSWWTVGVIHRGGSWLVRLVGLSALATFTASWRLPRLVRFRRGAAYVVLALVLCPATVAGLKQLTNVDCPRDLERYGGDRPYVRLFGDRPDGLPRGACYPGSHSSSGFALMSLYFVLVERRPRLARGLLAAAALTGAAFSFGQQARGAHFLSHDLASAAITWFLLLHLHLWLLESRATNRARLIPRAEPVQPPDGVPPRGPGIGRRQGTHPARARGRGTGIRRLFRRVFRARVPVCAAAPQWRRRSDPGGGARRADQGDAQPEGIPR